MRHALQIAILAALTATGPMAIDMYLPALPHLAEDMGGRYGEAELTLSTFLLGFSFSQIVYGPLADRLGRRGPLLFGLALFTLGSIGCAVAHDLPTLIALRFVQALGGGAGPMLARAIVRDLYAGPRVARTLSLMATVMSAAPLLAPLIGGQVLLLSGWRTIFWITAGFGLVMGTLTALYIPETLARGQRQTGSALSMVLGYGLLLKHPGYLSYAFAGAFLMGGVFAYLAGAPYVFITLYGVAPQHFGFFFGANVLGLMAASWLNSRIVMHFGIDRILRFGILLAAVSGVVAALVTLGHGGLMALEVPLFFFISSIGLVLANSIAACLNLFPERAGAASALVGCLQMLAGAVLGALVSLLGGGTALPMAGVMAGAGLTGLALQRSLAYLDLRMGLRARCAVASE